MKLVLPSESPFRKTAMDLLGLDYETCPSEIDEMAIRHDSPAELTRILAEAQALQVADKFPDAVVVSGDAVAALGDKIYEKPRSLNEAAQFLQELSGNPFQVVTSLTVLHSKTRKMLSAVESSDITFRPLANREIRDYINRYPVLNYAGAFEGDAVRMLADRICGSYNIGTGLPVSRLIVFLREQGVDI